MQKKLDRQDVVEKLEQWQRGEISNWYISSWAEAILYNDIVYENDEEEIISDTIYFLALIGSGDGEQYSPEQLLEFMDCQTREEADSFVEERSGLLEMDFNHFFPRREELIQRLDAAEWFEGMTEEQRREYCENIYFQKVPEYGNNYYCVNQELYWLPEMRVMYNESEEGDINEDGGRFHLFLDKLEVVTDVDYELLCENDVSFEHITFSLDGIPMELHIVLNERDTVFDFFEQLEDKLAALTDWTIHWSAGIVDPGDFMFLTLIKKDKLEKAYRAGAIRPEGIVA